MNTLKLTVLSLILLITAGCAIPSGGYGYGGYRYPLYGDDGYSATVPYYRIMGGHGVAPYSPVIAYDLCEVDPARCPAQPKPAPQAATPAPAPAPAMSDAEIQKRIDDGIAAGNAERDRRLERFMKK